MTVCLMLLVNRLVVKGDQTIFSRNLKCQKQPSSVNKIKKTILRVWAVVKHSETIKSI